MKKIRQGKYELNTTMADAIDKFRQMNGICNEEISGENSIEFYCSKIGKITIVKPQTTRSTATENSTNLFAEVNQQNGKTYVTYYTCFSRFINVFKMVYLVISLLMAVVAIALSIIGVDKTYYIPILVLCLGFFGVELFAATKDKKNSPNDSEIMIKELEKRVEAVNLWDK